MADRERGRFSQWRTDAIRGLDEAAARERALGSLERRGRSPDEVAARAAYLDLLGIEPGERVLEVGCGSGVVLRDVARRVAPGGVAIGLDPSPAMLAVARELAEQHGLADVVELREGDARALPFGDAQFDVVLAVTTLLHVPDGERAIPEMVRVTRPGGRVAVFDRDNDSYIISHPDRTLTRRIVAAGSDHSAVNGWIGRQAPRLMAEAGLRDVRVRAFASIEQDPAGFYATNAGVRWADIAVQVGAISEEERRRWVDQLRAEQEAGGFIAGLTHIFVWGTRPD
jgi:ubiquinone/menaquinone biosynthesis C-methylase UbiE